MSSKSVTVKTLIRMWVMNGIAFIILTKIKCFKVGNVSVCKYDEHYVNFLNNQGI